MGIGNGYRCTMQQSPSASDGEWSDWNVDVVADATRRRCLSILLGCSTAIKEEVLATNLAAACSDKSPVGVTTEEQERVHVQLVHKHLPALDDAGYVEWDRESGAVESADHPAFQSPTFERLLETTDEDVGPILASLDHRRRRTALSVLADATEAIGRSTLVRRVLARENGVRVGAVSHQEREAASARFHHVHLPKLAEADLIERDEDGIRYGDHPVLEAGWIEFDLTHATRPATGGPNSAD